MTPSLKTLSEQWNAAGRHFAKDVQSRLERFHKGGVEDPELPSDPRSEALANEVLSAVCELNGLGRWREARQWFDPAHAPFIPHMRNESLPFVVALGESEALFRRGSTHQHGHLWYVAGDRLEPLPELLAAAISPNRKMLALADANGIRVRRGWNGAEVAYLPWPSREQMVPPWVPEPLRDRYDVDPPATTLAYLCVADSGLRVAIAVQSGVLVGTVSEGRVRWHQALPKSDEPNKWVLDDLRKGESSGFRGDMVHVAMTGDGHWLACGTQDEGHYVFAVDSEGVTRSWSTLGYASEYPHNACFSSDGTHIALNSCHFYSGATIAAETHRIEGVVTEPYDEDPRAPVINSYLRVYASTWLPASALPEKRAAFALAGAGALTIVTPAGEVLHELMFGSSACGIDYCPVTNTLILGSYSGFLHFLRPTEVDPFGIGWRPFKELKRWCFLKEREPFQW